MDQEVGTASEALLTLRALVGSVFRVDALMVIELRTALEALLTLGTLEGFLSCVDGLMDSKVAMILQALPTFTAWALPVLLADFLGAQLFRLLLTFAAVQAFPPSLSWMVSQRLLHVLSLLQASLEFPSGFPKRDAPARTSGYTTLLQILL